MRHCAEAEVAVEFCRADESCTAAKMTNAHGQRWPVIEELERSAEQACALHSAVVADKGER